VTITKSDTGTYAGKFESLDQGATVPFDTVTVNGDDVRMEVTGGQHRVRRHPEQRTNGASRQVQSGGQAFPLTFTRVEQAVAAPPKPTPAPTPKPKPDYSAPADAPYTAEGCVCIDANGPYPCRDAYIAERCEQSRSPSEQSSPLRDQGPKTATRTSGCRVFCPFDRSRTHWGVTASPCSAWMTVEPERPVVPQGSDQC
jgi:hypothetical protein